MQHFANPARFLNLANAVLPWIWLVTLALFAVGLYGALFAAPADYQQGETVRIMFVHVPAAWLALLVYSVMALRDQLIPPGLNLSDPEDSARRFDLVPNIAKPKALKHVLSNSFGFGGVNAALVFSAF